MDFFTRLDLTMVERILLRLIVLLHSGKELRVAFFFIRLRKPLPT